MDDDRSKTLFGRGRVRSWTTTGRRRRSVEDEIARGRRTAEGVCQPMSSAETERERGGAVRWSGEAAGGDGAHARAARSGGGAAGGGDEAQAAVERSAAGREVAVERPAALERLAPAAARGGRWSVAEESGGERW